MLGASGKLLVVRHFVQLCLPLIALTACVVPPELPVSKVVAGIKLRGGDFGNDEDHLVSARRATHAHGKMGPREPLRTN